MTTARRFAVVGAAIALAACTQTLTPQKVPVSDRDDLELLVYQVPVTGGRTPSLTIPVPEGTLSMLIEVQGTEGGYYFLDQFIGPNGTDLSQSGQFTTREARELPGLVDFLYPNDGETVVIPGDYELILRATEDYAPGSPALASDELEVRVYLVRRAADVTCSLRLDFLVDNTAVEAASLDLAIERSVAGAADLFASAGIVITDYQIQRLDLSDLDVDIGSLRALTTTAGAALAQAVRWGSLRQDAVHIIMVRSIGETTSTAGYSMGLPGPYDATRPNSTVFVSTSAYAEPAAGDEWVLDVESLSVTLAHELGHYLGLYHTSEGTGVQHDPIKDTDQCISVNCSPAFLRNVMTPSGWLFNDGLPTSHRDRLSPLQAAVLRRHPLCVPIESGPIQQCTKPCSSPNTCAVLGGEQLCLTACAPDATDICGAVACIVDDRGTYVCQP